MQVSEETLDSLRADKIRAARSMTPEQRLSAGGELFDAACEIARVGIRMQFPEATDAEVEAHLARRIALLQRPGR